MLKSFDRLKMVLVVFTNLIRMKIDEVTDDLITQMLVNNPVHQLEACEGDGKKDTAVLVNVRGSHAEHLVQVLHVAVGVGRRGISGTSARGTIGRCWFGSSRWPSRWPLSRIGGPHGQWWWWANWRWAQWGWRSPHEHVLRGHHVHRGWGRFFIIATHGRATPTAVHRAIFGTPATAWGLSIAPSRTAASPSDGVFARTTLTMHFRVVHLKVNRL